MELVSGLSLANNSHSVPPGGTQISAKMDSGKKDAGRLVGLTD